MATITAIVKDVSVAGLASQLAAVQTIATAIVSYKSTVRPDGVEYSAIIVFDDTGGAVGSSTGFTASTPEDLATAIGAQQLTSIILYETTVRPDGVEYSAIVLTV